MSDPADEILADVGLKPRQSGNALRDILENQGLGLDRVIAELSDIMTESPDRNVRLRATETALKLHRVMEDEKAPAPAVTIVIQGGSGHSSIPSILLPREITVAAAQISSGE
jgi:hypothetical protein